MDRIDVRFLLIALVVIPHIGVNQTMMSEISQINKNVIRMVLRINTMRVKGLSRTQINAIRLNFKTQEVPTSKVPGRPQSAQTLGRPNNATIRQPIADRNVINEYNLEADAERFISLSNVILHRLLSMTDGESHAPVQSLICTWENRSNVIEMLKHYMEWLQNIQEYETTHKTRISNNIKIALVVNSVRGQLRNHLLLSMSHLMTSRARLQASSNQHIHNGGHAHQGHQPMEIDPINGFQGTKGKGMSKGPPVKGTGKGKKGKTNNIRASSGVRIRIRRKAVS
eukprot:3971423-Amphidinium_carterae.1